MSKEEEDTYQPNIMSTYLKTSIPYFTTVIVLLVNLLAVSIYLNCNYDKNILVRVIMAAIVFMFSIPYLALHFIRVVIFNKEGCTQNHIKFFN